MTFQPTATPLCRHVMEVLYVPLDRPLAAQLVNA